MMKNDIFYVHVMMKNDILYVHVMMKNDILYVHVMMKNDILYVHEKMKNDILYVHVMMKNDILYVHVMNQQINPVPFFETKFLQLDAWPSTNLEVLHELVFRVKDLEQMHARLLVHRVDHLRKYSVKILSEDRFN